MRPRYLLVLVLSGCGLGGSGGPGGGGDTDVSASGHPIPYCQGHATLGVQDLDPCEKAGASLTGVEPAGVAADWGLSFGTDSCFWIFDLDDLCGDGDVWFGGGAGLRASATGCGVPTDGSAIGVVHVSDYALTADGDAWVVSASLDWRLTQAGVALNGDADVAWRVPASTASASFTRCANQPLGEESTGESVPSKVDVLLVVDNSCSMIEEQAQLGATLPTIADQLDARGVDYQVGVVSTDVADTRQNGKLVQAAGTSYKWVTPSTPDRDTVFGALVALGTGGSSTEQGLLAATRALSEPLISTANAGFIRDDANLAIVIVSDEEDQSAPRITKTEFIDLANSLKSSTKDVTFSSIVGDAPNGCHSLTADAVPGTIYMGVTDAVGGAKLSICSTDWTPLADALDVSDPNILQIPLAEPAVAVSIQVIAHESGGDRVLVRDTDWTWIEPSVRVTRSSFEVGASLTVEYAPRR